MKGVVVSCEHGEETFSCGIVHLDTKTLEIHNFEVAPVKDNVKNWALNTQTVSSKIDGLLKIDSEEIKHRIQRILAGTDFYFVSNVQTIDILANVFKISKSNIYYIRKSLSEEYTLRCLSCGEESQCCNVFDVIPITNFLCNQHKEYLPDGLEIADACVAFKFESFKPMYKTRYSLFTADKIECISRYNTDPTSDSSDDEIK